MRIAIIEDDEITRLELSKLLNTQGYETVLLTDFGNLTEELKQYSIELVLLDINLPYENGYEVCRKIKQVMPVPIIFVTSRDTNADELKSIQVGGMGLYLSKKLCDRLGLKLDIASTEKEYTRLTIIFPKGTVHNFSE